jgi:hypothetical protein
LAIQKPTLVGTNEALCAFDGAHQSFKALNNEDDANQALVCKSRSLLELKHTNEAASLLKLILSADGVSPLIRSQALTNLAVLESTAHPHFARELLQQDLELHGQLDDDYGLAGTLINLALIEMKQGNTDKAVVLLESARNAASRVTVTRLIF